MSAVTLNILLVEDSHGDALLLRGILTESSSSRLELAHLKTRSGALCAVVEHEFRLVLLDLGSHQTMDRRPSMGFAPECLNCLLSSVLTGNDDDSSAARSLHEGAQNYLVKGRLTVHSSFDHEVRHR